MFGLIVEEMKSKYFTNFKEVFDMLGEEAHKHNWLLSGYECNSYPSERIPFAEPFVWLSGDELLMILEKHEFQFIWCVATAYTKETAFEEVMRYPIPFADGYEGFWTPCISMQNPLSVLEIVSWDSTFLLIISKSEEIIERFAHEYPASTDLVEYNRVGLNDSLGKALSADDDGWVKSISLFIEKYDLKEYVDSTLYKAMKTKTLC